MSTPTLFDAPEITPQQRAREKRNKILLYTLIVVICVGGALGVIYRNILYERTVDKFFERVEAKDYEGAFALWNADPNWKQNVNKYPYTYGQFQLDWGPSGEYGPITSHKIEGSVKPRSNITEATGVVVVVTVNNRAEPACLWVDRKTKAISFSPIACAK